MEDRINNIDSIFKKIELQGVNINTQLLYGYFFVDNDKKKLNTFKDKLIDSSFDFVSIEKLEDEFYLLHIEKIEIHSKKSLLNQITDFEKLAKTNNIQSFDGWDIGNSDKSKPLISNDNFNKLLIGKTPQELFKFAEELLEYGVFDKSVIVFDKCLENKFEIENSLYKQFICYDYLEEPQNGISNLKKVLDINPNHFKACFNIGALSYSLDDYTTSIEFYEKATKIDENSDSAFYGISLSQYCIEEIQKSEENCKRALALNPQNENAKELLEIILDRK